MGHFILKSSSGEVHIYCRDADTYEEIFEAGERLGSLIQVRGGQEARIPVREGRLHLFVKESRVFAVNLEGSSHPGKTFRLPDAAADALLNIFPGLKMRKDRRLPSAPFGPSMLPVLTDF